MGLGSVVFVWAVYLLRLWCRSFIDSSRPSVRMHSNIMYVLESILTTSDEHALGIHDPSVDMTFTHALARSLVDKQRPTPSSPPPFSHFIT